MTAGPIVGLEIMKYGAYNKVGRNSNALSRGGEKAVTSETGPALLGVFHLESLVIMAPSLPARSPASLLHPSGKIGMMIGYSPKN